MIVGGLLLQEGSTADWIGKGVISQESTACRTRIGERRIPPPRYRLKTGKTAKKTRRGSSAGVRTDSNRRSQDREEGSDVKGVSRKTEITWGG